MKWPEQPRLALGVVLFVALAFLVTYGGASWLSGFVPWRVRLDLPFEQAIPFVPWSAVVYLSMDLLVGLAVFTLPQPRQLLAFAAVLVAQMLIGAAFFVLMPVADPFPPRAVEGAAAGSFWLADTLNLERNYFPSLHVAFSVTAARAYGGRGWWAWAAAIAASTVLMHEHCLLDVAGGVALALLATRLWLARLEIEADVAATLWRVGLRHRRYVLINVVLYAVTAFSRRRRALRTGYALLQVLDDVLDGDRPLATMEAPDTTELALAQRISRELETGRFSTDLAGRLAEAFHADAPVEAHRLARRLIETMCRDAERRLARARWTAEALRAQHRATFSDSLEVLLVCGGAKTRAAQLPATVDLLAWASVLRDLDDDLSHGLVNVPTPVEPRDPVALSAWKTSERQRGAALIEASERELSALDDPDARWVRHIARSAHKYARG